LENVLKLHAWPQSRDANHWHVETLHVLLEGSSECTPSIRAGTDLPDVYRRAFIFHLRRRLKGQGAPRPAPELCPFGLDDLLVPNRSAPDIDGF
jgi:hypothetical protein